MTSIEDLAEAGDAESTPARLYSLTSHADADVRRAVAQNLASPKQALSALFEEFPTDILNNPASAMFSLEIPENPFDWLQPQRVRFAVASNEATPSAVLEWLLQDASLGVRNDAIQNPSLSIDVLERLAYDPDMNVRASTAQNPSLPIATLERLSNDPAACVRDWVARHPKTPRAVIKHLARDPVVPVRTSAQRRLDEP